MILNRWVSNIPVSKDKSLTENCSLSGVKFWNDKWRSYGHKGPTDML